MRRALLTIAGVCVALAVPTLAQAPAPTAIPATMRGIFAALAADRRDAQVLIDRGRFNKLYAPEDRIRARALALDRDVATLPPAARHRAGLAIHAVVRETWLLDLAVDEGVNAQAIAAFARVRAALDELSAAFAVRR